MRSSTSALEPRDDEPLPGADSGAWSAEVERFVDGLDGPESAPRTLRLHAEERRFLVASAFSSDVETPESGTTVRSSSAADDEETIPPTLRVPAVTGDDEVTPDSTPSVVLVIDAIARVARATPEGTLR